MSFLFAQCITVQLCLGEDASETKRLHAEVMCSKISPITSFYNPFQRKLLCTRGSKGMNVAMYFVEFRYYVLASPNFIMY